MNQEYKFLENEDQDNKSVLFKNGEFEITFKTKLGYLTKKRMQGESFKGLKRELQLGSKNIDEVATMEIDAGEMMLKSLNQEEKIIQASFRKWNRKDTFKAENFMDMEEHEELIEEAIDYLMISNGMRKKEELEEAKND